VEIAVQEVNEFRDALPRTTLEMEDLPPVGLEKRPDGIASGQLRTENEPEQELQRMSVTGFVALIGA
jgi:hypothetical protein